MALGAWLSTRAVALGVALLSAGSIACAGHEDRTRTALEALDQGAPARAVAALNEELEVERAEDLPSLAGDNALLLLDRGSILLSMENHKLSARDLGAADKAIDLLDMTRGAAAEIGKYLYSDDAGPYKAPAYEKLMINTINMMNYLALKDLTGAKVEARRLAVMQSYIKNSEPEETAMLGLGSYLAGFAFEKAGSRDEALNYYDDALRYAQYGSLRDALRTLTQGQPRSPGIDALVGEAGPLESPAAAGKAEILVVIAYGRVPQKVPVRLPIGLALTMVADDLSPYDHARASALAAKGLVTWVNYPKLGKGRGGYETPTFALDGKLQDLEQGLNAEEQVRAAWEKKEGTMVLSAITRMLTRVAAGEIAQAGTTAAAGEEYQGLGVLAALLTSATLAVLDTPDTRCWSTLPAYFAISRVRVDPGTHTLHLGARGENRTVKLKLAAGDWAFVPHVVLR